MRLCFSATSSLSSERCLACCSRCCSICFSSDSFMAEILWTRSDASFSRSDTELRCIFSVKASQSNNILGEVLLYLSLTILTISYYLKHFIPLESLFIYTCISLCFPPQWYIFVLRSFHIEHLYLVIERVHHHSICLCL